VRSNLEIPAAISKFFSLYLLMALGLKGGASLAATGLPLEGVLALLAAVVMAALVPAYSFLILGRRTSPFDAAAVAATYGSVSAVTFIAAQQFLRNHDIAFGGHMTVARRLFLDGAGGDLSVQHPARHSAVLRDERHDLNACPTRPPHPTPPRRLP